jgi:peptidoglycan/xylan/chitin deacetylase (PgdA/CDA1 family)
MTKIDKHIALTIYMLTPLLALILLLSGGCATTQPTTESPGSPGEAPATVAEPRPTKEYRSDDYIVLTAVSGSSYESLARSYLGDENLAYLISEFNKNTPIAPGERIVIPLKPENPGGIYTDGYLTVPVLCYHRFSKRKSHDKISVSEETFERQIAYLKNNGYTPITLRQFFDFIELRRRPPQKSLLITIDDGWKSAKSIAYPILKKYGFHAVLFIYPDNIGTKQNSVTLTWDDLRELNESGLFEIESHSVSHSDLTKISDEQLNEEIGGSQRIIKSMLGITTTFMAYPYGLINQKIINAMQKNGYKGGFTVIRGANPFFNAPYALNRSMVYHSEKIDDFAKMLETFRRE